MAAHRPQVAADSRYYAPVRKASQLAVFHSVPILRLCLRPAYLRCAGGRRHAQKVLHADIGFVHCNHCDWVRAAFSSRCFGSLEGIDGRYRQARAQMAGTCRGDTKSEGRCHNRDVCLHSAPGWAGSSANLFGRHLQEFPDVFWSKSVPNGIHRTDVPRNGGRFNAQRHRRHDITKSDSRPGDRKDFAQLNKAVRPKKSSGLVGMPNSTTPH